MGQIDRGVEMGRIESGTEEEADGQRSGIADGTDTVDSGIRG